VQSELAGQLRALQSSQNAPGVGKIAIPGMDNAQPAERASCRKT